MAFNFLGTLSLEQLRDLRSFLEEEIELIDEQINNLRVEVDNTKRLRQEFITADNNFGGNTKIYETELPDVIRVPRQDDSNSARIMEKIKKPFIQNIKFKRERLEFKIKKLTDFIEQLRESIDRKAIAKTQTIQLLNELEQMFNADNADHLFQTTDELENYQKGIQI